ncbi:hypothetical protein GPECTOR_1g822 [Gonium pectorale]|uniref:PhoD-like phosphatase domain-containing protein n=1 Tax=Gonium pectorale TaxID=33097 RepID=A0A150H4C9_GONPE|nr:hypothetical protein GPECTOR_1g822 [Gonium pectorale]|eukprot:KXZ56912.1 hypothetical protein GPECTOR_1g822 [Gonium pectorale]
MFGGKKQDSGGPPDRQPSPERRGLLGGLFGRTNSSDPHGGMPPGQHGGEPGAGQPSVTVVPPASGLCSKQPLPAEEVARLQSTPLAASKVGLPSQPPPDPHVAPSAAAAAPGPGQPGLAGGFLNALKPTRTNAGMVVDPNFSGPPPLEDKFGPYLRLGGYDPTTRIYSASVMMIIHQSRSPYPPHLRYRDMNHRGSEVALKNPIHLFAYAGYNFWRWDMTLQLGPVPTTIEYAVIFSTDHFFTTPTRYRFQLPSAAQTWHWGFYSCNGFHDPKDEAAKGGIQPLWRDVMRVHATQPLHAMVGGGDQLYCDDVWNVPSLRQWTSIQDKPSRNSYPFSQAMVNETYDYYFRNYTHHFGKEVFRDALASIPQVMIWDDHDIFDGWGSYPAQLQNCPVFAGVFYVARKFYLLFQCHATEDNYRQLNKGWGLTGLSLTRMLGSSTAVVALDSRGERTREAVLRPATWAAFQDQVAKLPAGVRHVVVLATVPVIYPTVPCLEDAMDALAGTGIMGNAMSLFLQKTGLSSQIYSQFGEPELLDDLLDHWSAKTHEEEKTWFVHLMQDLAAARGIRFTLLSGDVHCAGVGCFQTMPKVNLKRDHRYIRQVISSAIGNVPPPDAVLKALSASNRIRMLDSVTREKMSYIFENRTLLKGARNWCDVQERPLLYGSAAAAATLAGGVSGGPADGSLIFQLRCEHPTYSSGQWAAQLYDVEVPILELPPGSYSPGPLAVAPPMPATLMQRFQAELLRAGVGLQEALPPPDAAEAAANGPLQPQLTVQGAPGGEGQAGGPGQPPGVQHLEHTLGAGAEAGQGEGQANQLLPAVQQLSLAEAAPQPPQPLQHAQQPQEEFGLQSDVQQHQQQQDQARAAPGTAATAAAAAPRSTPTSGSAKGSHPIRPAQGPYGGGYGQPPPQPYGAPYGTGYPGY